VKTSPVAIAGALLIPLLAAGAASAGPPRLGVLVVVDQLRSADVDRLAPLFCPGGFGGLERRGARADLRYPFAVTETGPGHATIATGASPSVHGICSNRWWNGEELWYAVRDDASPILGAAEGSEGRGPKHLLVGTLGDAMKVDSRGASRVVTISGKDRAAILTGGHAADLAVWYDAKSAAWTTSRAYADALPEWLSRRGPKLVHEAFTSGRWSPLPTPAEHTSLLPPDDAAGESDRLGGHTFPHDLADVSEDKKRRSEYRGTPQALEHTFALARAAIEEERLGDDAVPDLLVIGLSAIDFSGHWYGPTSLETTDLLRRADRELRALLTYLDARLGSRGYALAVTGDHGSASLPETALAAGYPAGRISARALFDDIEAKVKATLPAKKAAAKAKRLVGFQPPHLWLDLDDLDDNERDTVLETARRRLEQEPGILRTYRLDLPDPPGDPFIAMLREGSHRDREGELAVLPRPRWIFDWGGGHGTDHGTPWLYDRRVPLLITGPGVRRGRYADAADPRDVAPTLAFLLRAPPPDAAQGHPLAFMLRR
jgi:predicted AlkP superfamily pyrophosphatase or phosphodiesterase